MAYYQQCGGADACTMAELATCSQYFGQFSAGFIDAINSCVNPPYTCSDGGIGMSSDSCVQAKIAMLQPTAAAAKLKSDFCSACPDGKSPSTPQSCSAFFSSDGGSSIGSAFLELTDAVAEQVDQKCLPMIPDAGVADCQFAFDNCAGIVLQTAITEPAACTTDGG